ncbi:MAG: hypothetical protein JST67_01730 [Bacteroidetes bacterium]|nr:hypothetical protein [Bacteroidota bacterium]
MLFKIRGKKDLFLVILLLIVFNVIELVIPSRIGNKAGYITGTLTFIALTEVIQFIFKQYGRAFFIALVLVLLFLFAYAPHIVHMALETAYLIGIYCGFILTISLRVYNEVRKIVRRKKREALKKEVIKKQKHRN